MVIQAHMQQQLYATAQHGYGIPYAWEVMRLSAPVLYRTTKGYTLNINGESSDIGLLAKRVVYFVHDRRVFVLSSSLI